MGCICSKGKSANEYVADNHLRKDKELKANRSSNHLGTAVTENDATARLISNTPHAGTEGSSDEGEKEKNAAITIPPVQMGFATGGGQVQGQPRVSRIYSVTRGERGAQVLAGWPSWLTAVAGEAISGWIPRRADSFEKLDKAS
ncbi:putative serine/threonine-protein kinase [Sesbania bispinosa]|nr:putative serine/threonine-protein kinase [Sesbania bispinosa]